MIKKLTLVLISILAASFLTLSLAQTLPNDNADIRFQSVESNACVSCDASYKTTKDYVALITARRFAQSVQKYVTSNVHDSGLEEAVAIFDLFAVNENKLTKANIDQKSFLLVDWSTDTPQWKTVKFAAYLDEWQAYLEGQFVGFFNEGEQLYLVTRKAKNKNEYQIWVSRYLVKDGVKGFYLDPFFSSAQMPDSVLFNETFFQRLREKIKIAG